MHEHPSICSELPSEESLCFHFINIIVISLSHHLTPQHVSKWTRVERDLQIRYMHCRVGLCIRSWIIVTICYNFLSSIISKSSFLGFFLLKYVVFVYRKFIERRKKHHVMVDLPWAVANERLSGNMGKKQFD